jgi:hypothetical protein
MDFKFPKPVATSLAQVLVPKDVAIVAFHQATDAGMLLAKESYVASFETDSTTDSQQITVLTLAKWINAYYKSQ